MVYKVWADGDVLTAGDLNIYLMRQSVIVCTSGTRPSTPGEGLTIYETDTDLFRIYSGSTWETFAAAARATVTDAQAGQYTATITTYGVATASGTYADCGAAFVAPWSGRVIVHTNATLSSTGSDVFVAPVVRTGGTVGSGSVVTTSLDSTSVRSSTTTTDRKGVTQLISGLTPGSTYNVRVEHRVNSGTGTISSRLVIAQPTT